MGDAAVADVAIDFIAFCYQRDRREWPRLYDEMCYVASKRLYRGLGYSELKDAGVDLTFSGMSRLSRIAKEVVRELGTTAPAPKREFAASY
ncbi:MAG: hypothetical protein KGJ98_10440 [Chloroflexota bacterium]|nr:hypothetical protein [Chloroflexota bacterium]